MKFKFLIFTLIGIASATLIVSSCSNDTAENTEEKVESADSTIEEGTADAAPYSVEFNEDTQELNLVKSGDGTDNFTALSILGAINAKHEGIKADFVSAGTDTIHVKIDDANKLTQGMGTTGADAYMAELTYSLTELPGIKAVKIDFEVGDHAMPGVYTRADFKDLKSKGN